MNNNAMMMLLPLLLSKQKGGFSPEMLSALMGNGMNANNAFNGFGANGNAFGANGNGGGNFGGNNFGQNPGGNGNPMMAMLFSMMMRNAAPKGKQGEPNVESLFGKDVAAILQAMRTKPSV